MKTTNIQFKILYAIGIFFVVSGHYANGGMSFFYEWFRPYAFHLGLFVFCSGYFYKKDSEEHIGAYIVGRIKKFIIPLYLWNLFYGLLVLFINMLGGQIPIKFNWYTLLVSPINNGHQFVFNLASWFIFPLVMVQIFVIILRKLLHCIWIKNETVICVIILLLGMLGLWPATQGYYTGWMLVLSRFAYFLPFYGVGYFYRGVLEEKLDQVKSTVYFFVVFGIQTITMIVYGDAYAYTPSWCDNFDNCFMPYVIGFVGIAFWVRCAKLLIPVLGKSKLVLAVADNTFSIMMHHYLGLYVINGLFAILRYFEIACSSFDLSMYISNIQYVYIPFGIQPFAMLMVLGSMLFAIVFGKLPNLCCNGINKIIAKMK